MKETPIETKRGDTPPYGIKAHRRLFVLLRVSAATRIRLAQRLLELLDSEFRMALLQLRSFVYSLLVTGTTVTVKFIGRISTHLKYFRSLF